MTPPNGNTDSEGYVSQMIILCNQDSTFLVSNQSNFLMPSNPPPWQLVSQFVLVSRLVQAVLANLCIQTHLPLLVCILNCARCRARDGKCLITGLQSQSHSRLDVSHIFPRAHDAEVSNFFHNPCPIVTGARLLCWRCAR